MLKIKKKIIIKIIKKVYNEAERLVNIAKKNSKIKSQKSSLKNRK